VTSVVAIGIVPGVAALVMGIVAVGRIDDPANRLAGRGHAIAGAISGGVAIVTSLAAMFVWVIGFGMYMAFNSVGAFPQAGTDPSLYGLHVSLSAHALDHDGHYPGLDAQGRILPPDPALNLGPGDTVERR